MNAGQKWDQVSDKFNTYKKEIWHGAADNIDATWPIILKYIKNNFPNPKNLTALEFGCGTGMFCKELKNLGFTATGIDISTDMIDIGKKNLDPSIKLMVGDSALAAKEGRFDLVTSIMALQFLTTDEIQLLAQSVNSGGHLIFAVFNPEQLTARGVSDTFTLSDTNVSLPIFKRSAEDYYDIFKTLGFAKTFEEYTEASKKYLQKYSVVSVPKYMVLGYKKQ